MTTSALPGSVRLSAWVALVVAGVMGLWASHGVGLLFELERLETTPSSGLTTFSAHPEQAKALAGAALRAQARVLESMRISRAVILFALSVACALTFVSALRLLRPAGLSREGVRRLLASAATGVAVLRTLDGAQDAVVARASAQAMGKYLTDHPDPNVPAELAAVLPQLAVGVSAAVTFVLVGTLLVISHHFKSEKVRLALEGLDDLSSPDA